MRLYAPLLRPAPLPLAQRISPHGLRLEAYRSEKVDCLFAPLPHTCRTVPAAPEVECQVLSIAARRWQAETFSALPFSRVNAAVYVQDFTGCERGVCQKQDCIHDF